MDITTIPTEELLSDLSESITDINHCLEALIVGVITYRGESVVSRLQTNRRIVALIEDELRNRGVEYK